MTDYRLTADRVAADIASGRLRPGDRLPPQRDFADARGIAVSTASRVYRELRRRGLVVGEVGRGTFVKAGVHRPMAGSAEPHPSMVNLDTNVCVLPDQAPLLAKSLAALTKRPAAFEPALQLVRSTNRAARQTVAAFLSRPGWQVDPECVCFAGHGRQALAACISAIVPVGERLGVDPLTYPAVKSLAAGLGVELVPIAGDGEGPRPGALEAAHRKTPLRAIYVQPTLHNPLGTTMPTARRAELAARLASLDIVAIEDQVYAFLDGGRAPFAAIAPERTIVVDSMSKRVAPGVTLGFIVAPRPRVPTLASAVRSGAWSPAALSTELSLRWIVDGTAARLMAAKRRDAKVRQGILREAFRGLSLVSNPLAYHGWLQLPEHWRAELFVTAAAQRGISITPASAFAIGPGHSPNAVRIALASPPIDVLTHALHMLADLARSAPSDWNTE